jgi:hypothetical protein
MSALGNGPVPYSPSAPGFILPSSEANGTGGLISAYESNQMGYVNSHPILPVTTGGKRKRKSRRLNRRSKFSKKGSKKSRRRCKSYKK